MAVGVVLVALLLPESQIGISPGRVIQCRDNLKQIGLALHNYHDVYGCFPPAYIADETGRPMHSWRVLILPYLDQQPLYARYRFDEPWNGPNNSLLANEIVTTYQCPSDAHERASPMPWTSYVAVVGPHTCWPGAEPCRIPDIADGIASTLHVVEVKDSGIHWMEPRDFVVNQMARTINPEAGQGMSSKHEGGAQGLITDGSARYFPDDLPAETLRRLIERDDGEEVRPF